MDYQEIGVFFEEPLSLHTPPMPRCWWGLGGKVGVLVGGTVPVKLVGPARLELS